MEFYPSPINEQTQEKRDLTRVFGKGVDKIVAQIMHDNPELSDEDAIIYTWHLIPEATAYMMPADPEDLTENAINIHEGYEAFRRIQE